MDFSLPYLSSRLFRELSSSFFRRGRKSWRQWVSNETSVAGRQTRRQIHRPLTSNSGSLPHPLKPDATDSLPTRSLQSSAPPNGQRSALPYAAQGACFPVSEVSGNSLLLPAEKSSFRFPGRQEEVLPHAAAWGGASRRGAVRRRRELSLWHCRRYALPWAVQTGGTLDSGLLLPGPRPWGEAWEPFSGAWESDLETPSSQKITSFSHRGPPWNRGPRTPSVACISRFAPPAPCCI